MFGVALALYLSLSGYEDTVTNREVIVSPGRVTGVTMYDCPGLAHPQPKFFFIMEAPPERTPCARGRSLRTRVLVGGEIAAALGLLTGWRLARKPGRAPEQQVATPA